MTTQHEHRFLKPGKLPAHILDRLLKGIAPSRKDPRLVIGPRLGEDAAHISFGERTLLAKTDPITFATEHIGWYALNVNANDIAVAGGDPKWFLATALLPPGTTEKEVQSIFEQLGAAAEQLGVSIAGGHTEITPAVKQPVICGSMLGEAPASGTVSSAGALPGDHIILTKGIAIEGTAILANELRSQLAARGISKDEIEEASALLMRPGISVLKDARTAISAAPVNAMHDPTEGGLATALHEIAFASNVNLCIEEGKVPILASSRKICRALKIDPWGLISSGALLIAASPSRVQKILDAMQQEGIQAQTIGAVTEKRVPNTPPRNLLRASDGALRPLPTFERDEIARAFENIINKRQQHSC